MYQADIELTPEFLREISELPEDPDIVVEKLNLLPVDLLRLRRAHEFSSAENEAYRRLLGAAMARQKKIFSLQEEKAEGLLAGTVKSVGAVARVVLGGLLQSGRAFGKKRPAPKVYSSSTHGDIRKVSSRYVKERPRERDLSYDE